MIENMKISLTAAATLVIFQLSSVSLTNHNNDDSSIEDICLSNEKLSFVLLIDILGLLSLVWIIYRHRRKSQMPKSIKKLQETAVNVGEKLMTTVSSTIPQSDTIKSSLNRAKNIIRTGTESIQHEAENIAKRVQNFAHSSLSSSTSSMPTQSTVSK